MSGRHISVLFATAFCICSLGAVAQVEQASPVEWLGPYYGPLPGTEPEGLSITLVRDLRTGVPLAGVVLRRYRESIDPRVRAAPFLGESRSDAYGLVSAAVEEDDFQSHWVFEVPGHAVQEGYGRLSEPIVELSPGRELHGLVLGPAGHPVADMPVELFLGCGHSPSVRRAWTDPQGRFLIGDLEPFHGTLWIPGPGLTTRNVVGPSGSSQQPMLVHTDPGIVLRGRVVDESGRPLSGMVIRSTQETRGPTAVTGPEGRFELVGHDSSEGLRICGPEGRETYIYDASFDPKGPVRFVFPDSIDDDHDGPQSLPLRVRVVDAATGERVPGAILKLREAASGRIQWFDLGAGEEPCVPAGDYELSVGDSWSSHVSAPVTVALEEGVEVDLQIAARPQPLLVVEGKGFPSHRDAQLRLLLPDRSIVLPRDGEEPVFLPAGVEAVLRVEAEGLIRHFVVGPARDGRRRVELAWPARKRIVAEFGDQHALSLRHRESMQTESGVLETHAAGKLELVVRDPAFGEQEISVDVPDREGAELRVPAAALRPAGRLRVESADGSMLGEASITIDGERFELDEEGALESWHARSGAAIRVKRKGHATLRRVLDGPGPQTLRWGNARLQLKVKGAPEFVAYIDGDLFTGAAHPLVVAGLDAGSHRVIVAAKGRLGQIFRVTLREGESRLVELTLPPRP